MYQFYDKEQICQKSQDITKKNGFKNINQKKISFLKKLGTKFKTTVPYNPEQNRIA